ncbi:THO complex subunit 5 [Rhynchospora pubera]|uniref:THO complex subunit 5 n=1 Tax=Rhynchospora pubera TaxID=906938 RepID=A0AAV8HQV5_9POAL|nr:THO complex subunit 5 [Rhynchospora pubera]
MEVEASPMETKPEPEKHHLIPPPSKTNPKPGNPYSLLEETRTAMEEIAARMLSAKKEGRPKSELRELINQMSLLFISLRQVNRAILMEEDRVKAETESAKAPVDFTTLQLHNLLYEKNHYFNAIKACRNFTSKYPDIELVPEEEFIAKAPESIKGKALATDPAHDLMLKRLNYELYQRKELCKMHERMEHQKKGLLEKISERKRFLSSLPSQLKSLKKASLPVQQQLGILHSKRVKQNQMAELLPPPLYIAYSQLMAQKEAFGERIEVEIVGSMKDAQSFMLEQANKEHGQIENSENNKLEDDVMEEDENIQRRRVRPKKEVPKEAASDKEGINRIHPLKIMLSVLDENKEEKPCTLIVLRFEYLVKLNVVCVGVEDGDSSDKDILCNLFPDDTGTDLPNQTAKLCAGDALTFADMGSHPYKWAQHLAGIDFLPELPPSSESTYNESMKNDDLSASLTMYRHQNRIQTVLLKIRSRKLAQMALLKQLSCLSKLEWPPLNYDKAPWAGYTPSCRIDCWTLESSTESASFLSAPTAEVSGDFDRRSVTRWEEAESNREDGELPVTVHVGGATNPYSKETTPTPPDGPKADRIDFARSLSLLSKGAPSSKKGISVNPLRNVDDDEIMVDSESELELELTGDEIETEYVNVNLEKPWQHHALRDFKLILRKRCGKDEIVKLEAKVSICMEYPLRPPLFNLSIFPEYFHGSKWQIELRAMEAEINLHVLGVIPEDYENYVLANQIRCLAMLFDLNFGGSDERRKIASVVDMRIGEPSRSVRGRDRRMAIYWKSSF